MSKLARYGIVWYIFIFVILCNGDQLINALILVGIILLFVTVTNLCACCLILTASSTIDILIHIKSNHNETTFSNTNQQSSYDH